MRSDIRFMTHILFFILIAPYDCLVYLAIFDVLCHVATKNRMVTFFIKKKIKKKNQDRLGNAYI